MNFRWIEVLGTATRLSNDLMVGNQAAISDHHQFPSFCKLSLICMEQIGGKKKKETVDLHRNYLFTICAHITTDKQIKSKVVHEKISPYFHAHKNNVLSKCEVAHFTSLLKLSTIINYEMSTLPSLFNIVLLLNGGHNGANNNYICNSKDPRYHQTF